MNRLMMYLHAFLSTCYVDPTGLKKAKSPHLWLEAMTVLLENNWNHKPVGSEKTLFQKGTSFKVTTNVGTDVKWMCTIRTRADWLLLLRIIPFDSNTTLWLWSLSSLPHRRRRAWCRFDMCKTPHNRFLFEFPESCNVKINVLLETMWCVIIAHNERSVGCKSLCPLLPIIPFICVVQLYLLHLIKGLVPIALCLLTLCVVWMTGGLSLHSHIRPLLEECLTSGLKPEYKEVYIEI